MITITDIRRFRLYRQGKKLKDIARLEGRYIRNGKPLSIQAINQSLLKFGSEYKQAKRWPTRGR